MLIRRSSAATLQFANLIIIVACLSTAVESANVARERQRGRLRNYFYKTKCLRPLGEANGVEFEVADCSDINPDQIVEAGRFKNMVDEFGYIRFDLGGRCVSLRGFSRENGIRNVLWDCVNQENQKWKIVNGNPIQGSAFQLQLQSSGKCLTAEGGGTYLDQWDCIGTESAPHQSWILEILPNTPSVVFSKILLRNVAYKTKCLNAMADYNGATFSVTDCNASTPGQLLKMDGFKVMQNEAGGYVQFDVSGRCLSLKGFDKDNGVPVLLWDCVNQENQMWKIVNGVLGNSFQLQLKLTEKCLTAEGGGTYLDQWDCLGTNAAPHQSWTIDVIGSEPHTLM